MEEYGGARVMVCLTCNQRMVLFLDTGPNLYALVDLLEIRRVSSELQALRGLLQAVHLERPDNALQSVIDGLTRAHNRLDVLTTQLTPEPEERE
jgi:hypothetical protein